MSWKYWTARDDWEGSRSYILENDSRVEAHCGVLPLGLFGHHGHIRSAYFVDWAADPMASGAGVRLFRKMAGFVEIVCAIGGTPITRKILPKIGFGAANERFVLARPVRPVRQAATHQYRNWKLPARLVRNTVWRKSRPISRPLDWSFQLADPVSIPANLWHPTVTASLTRQRSSPVYAYFLACPFVRFEFFLAQKRGQPIGCFLLGFVCGQARIADLWLMDESVDDYRAMYRLALVAAMEDPRVAEVMTWASTPARLDALEQCGFRICGRDAIRIFPAEKIPPAGFDCQLIDSDEAFLTSGTPHFLT